MSIGMLSDAMKLYLVVWPPEKRVNTSLDVLTRSLAEKEEEMRLYLVTADHKSSNHSLYSLSESTTKRPLRVLLSYYYFKDTPLDEVVAQLFPDGNVDIFLDSGAFSAMTQGTSIDLKEYVKYIQKYKHLLTVYANLDVIKDAEATWKNQQRMEQEYGLSPLPVFHVQEEWSHLDRYLEHYPYIARDKVLGLSKFARIAHKHAHRLQLQERLVDQIAEEVALITGSQDVAVLAQGRHLCMEMRGIRTPGLMTSSKMLGVFRSKSEARMEFLQLVGGGK